MKINYKVYAPNKGLQGNTKAAWLSDSKRRLVIDETYEGENGNYTYRQLWENHPEIKSNWYIKQQRVD